VDRKIIFSLCDYSRVWGGQYEDEYDVRYVDLQSANPEDVRLLEFDRSAVGRVRGIIAQPPCTHLAGSGARWWASKGEAALLEALAVADACLRLVALYRPDWWALENPVGRLHRFYGPAAWSFNPADYAGWSTTPDEERYTKKTLIWGAAKKPEARGLSVTLGSKMHLIGPSPERANIRSKTPQGFARAFRAANP